jgi:hypothetical protein
MNDREASVLDMLSGDYRAPKNGACVYIVGLSRYVRGGWSQIGYVAVLTLAEARKRARGLRASGADLRPGRYAVGIDVHWLGEWQETGVCHHWEEYEVRRPVIKTRRGARKVSNE